MADAYCARSAQLGDLGRLEEALQDANSAMRLAPDTTSSLGCRAQVYFQAGQFDKAVADYTRAISFGSTEAWTFRDRGVSRFYLGRIEDAGSDFAKAYELGDVETKVNSAIWLAIAYGRLGKPLPEAIIKRATTEMNGGWPRPALAMLAGAMPPDVLLRTLAAKNGDERQMALSERYFYLGQHYLAAGDKKSAQAYFKKAREQKVIIYTEHTAAGFELQRLGVDTTARSSVPVATEKNAAAK